MAHFELVPVAAGVVGVVVGDWVFVVDPVLPVVAPVGGPDEKLKAVGPRLVGCSRLGKLSVGIVDLGEPFPLIRA
jgi:hypothetical protein